MFSVSFRTNAVNWEGALNVVILRLAERAEDLSNAICAFRQGVNANCTCDVPRNDVPLLCRLTDQHLQSEACRLINRHSNHNQPTI